MPCRGSSSKPPTICSSPVRPVSKPRSPTSSPPDGTRPQVTSGPALERAGDLASILSKLEDGDVLFIDEIHRLPRPVEEVLYPAMEDFRIDVVLGKGPAARSIPLDLARFTLVGATTRTGLITGPLRDRFGLVARLDYYEVDDLQSIAMRAAGILEVDIDEGAFEIARRSLHPADRQPVIAPVRDYAEVERAGHISAEVAKDGLSFFGVDELGLDKASRAVLDSVCRRFGGGLVGLSTLAISVSEPTRRSRTFQPYLIQQGLLMRTARPPPHRPPTPTWACRPSGHGHRPRIPDRSVRLRREVGPLASGSGAKTVPSTG